MPTATTPSLSFPSLPEDVTRTADVEEAHRTIKDLFSQISAVLRQEENDPIRLNLLRQQIFGIAMPILESFLPYDISTEWIVEVVHIFGRLALQLQDTALAADGV